MCSDMVTYFHIILHTLLIFKNWEIIEVEKANLLPRKLPNWKKQFFPDPMLCECPEGIWFLIQSEGLGSTIRGTLGILPLPVPYLFDFWSTMLWHWSPNVPLTP